MSSLSNVDRTQAIRAARNELDAAVANFDARRVESLRPVEAALGKLYTALKSAGSWSEDSTEARNFTLWKAQFLGQFLDDLELAEPVSDHPNLEAHEPHRPAEDARSERQARTTAR